MNQSHGFSSLTSTNIVHAESLTIELEITNGEGLPAGNGEQTNGATTHDLENYLEKGSFAEEAFPKLGAESLLMTIGAAITPQASQQSTNGGAISSLQMSEAMVTTQGIRLNKSINIVSLKAKGPGLSRGPGGQTN